MKVASTVIVLLGALVLLFALSTPPGEPESILLIVREDMSLGDIGRTLQDTSVIGHRFLFTAAFWLHSSVDIEPGGYRLTERMGSWRTVKVLIGDAQLRWVTIPEGLRKEEVAGIVGTVLEWTVVQQQRFIAAYQSGVYAEGVYFPDTYLIPHDATGGVRSNAHRPLCAGVHRLLPFHIADTTLPRSNRAPPGRPAYRRDTETQGRKNCHTNRRPATGVRHTL